MREQHDGQPTAYDLLKAEILKGGLAPGQKLVETTLAERFNVSRTPIREALSRLEQDGLTERRARGYFVRERSAEEILDIYESRCVLEAMAGRVAAERRSDHDLRQLKYISDLGPSIDTQDHAAMAEYNRLFHRTVWQAAHHEPLLDLLQRLDLHVGRYSETTLAHPGRWEQALKEHARLLKAIEQRNAESAERIAREHFTRARDIRLKLAYQPSGAGS